MCRPLLHKHTLNVALPLFTLQVGACCVALHSLGGAGNRTSTPCMSVPVMLTRSAFFFCHVVDGTHNQARESEGVQSDSYSRAGTYRDIHIAIPFAFLCWFLGLAC